MSLAVPQGSFYFIETMKKILLKISGEMFASKHGVLDLAIVQSLVEQIKSLQNTHQFGLVIGAGNFFRGAKADTSLKLSRTTADLVGMLGTVMNSVMLQDIFEQHTIKTAILSAIHIPEIGRGINSHRINEALANNALIIFAGGSGNPYMTTDTTSVIRALQMGASELWKATKVDYLFDKDPATYADAKPIYTCTHQEVLSQHLRAMDLTASTLAAENNLPIRLFNLFTPNALIRVAKDVNFGSTIK
ncbi:UMP kinase [Candidatus Dependentiae bacterium]|nr:UMP kinase [Candidatus Dependentiae bacterium]